MKKIKDFVKKNYKVAISFVLGMILCIGIGVCAVATKDVVYDNSKSGLTSTNLQGAIDELNTKATTKINEAKNEWPEGKICQNAISVSNPNSNTIAAYTYNSSSCITGEESTCKQTNCINYYNSNSCPAGTIIKYKVNSSTTKYFHILHDDGVTMTLQQRENTVYKTTWYSLNPDNSNGPTSLLSTLEGETSGWTNVNDQTYTMGTTNFNNTNAYTGCSSYNSCTTNTYTLGQRTGKARAITIQEATALGCTESNQSCPNFMNNYLYNSTSYGGTINDDEKNNGMIGNYGYWTMSAKSTSTDAWYVSTYGSLAYDQTVSWYVVSARAVVVVNK